MTTKGLVLLLVLVGLPAWLPVFRPNLVSQRRRTVLYALALFLPPAIAAVTMQLSPVQVNRTTVLFTAVVVECVVAAAVMKERESVNTPEELLRWLEAQRERPWIEVAADLMKMTPTGSPLATLADEIAHLTDQLEKALAQGDGQAVRAVAYRLRVLAADLRDVERLEPEGVEPEQQVALDSCLEAAARAAERVNGIRVRLDAPVGVNVHGNERLLKRAFFNLFLAGAHTAAVRAVDGVPCVVITGVNTCNGHRPVGVVLARRLLARHGKVKAEGETIAVQFKKEQDEP